MHVILNVFTLPLASNPKVPKYTARTCTARTSLCPSTIPSGTGWQLAWVNPAAKAAAARRASSLRAMSLLCPWRLCQRQKQKNGSFGSLCRSTLAPAKPKLPSGPGTHFMQDCWTQLKSLCAQVCMDVAMTCSTSTTWPSGACGEQSAKTLRKRCRERWVKCCLQRDSAACSWTITSSGLHCEANTSIAGPSPWQCAPTRGCWNFGGMALASRVSEQALRPATFVATHRADFLFISFLIAKCIFFESKE